MKPKLIAAVILLILLYVVSTNFYRIKSKFMASREIHSDQQVLRFQDFTCSGITGFTFRYPVFKDWKVKRIVSEKEGKCTIYFKWPAGISYEVPPQIKIEKISELGQKFMIEKLRGGSPSEDILDDSGMKIIVIMSAKTKNPAAIPYEYVPDPAMYIESHVFKKGEWDWLVFYGQDFGVRISRNMFGSLGHVEEAERKEIHEFDSDIFYRSIIETFHFDE